MRDPRIEELHGALSEPLLARQEVPLGEPNDTGVAIELPEELHVSAIDTIHVLHVVPMADLRPRAGHWVRTPFTGNIVPSSRFKNPIYEFYAKRMPLANNNPTDPTREPVNNFNASSMPNNAFNDSFNNRIDYQASNNHRFYVRWVRSNYLEDAQDYTFSSETGLMAWNEKRNTRSGAVDWTYTINPTTVLNVSLNANQFSLQNQRLGTRRYKPTDVGLPAYMDAKCGGSCVLPRVVWPGMTAWSGDMVLGVAVDGPAAGPSAPLHRLPEPASSRPHGRI